MAIFVSRAPMLSEYFKIEIDSEGELHTLPQVLDDFVPGTDTLTRALPEDGCSSDTTTFLFVGQ